MADRCADAPIDVCSHGVAGGGVSLCEIRVCGGAPPERGGYWFLRSFGTV